MANAQNVAKVGDAEYGTLQEAITEAPSGATIELLQNVDLSSVVTGKSRLAISKSLTFNGNNKVITIGGRGFGVGMNATSKIDVTFNDLTIINSSNSKDGARCIDTRGNVGSLTLNGVILSTEGAQGGYTQPLTIGGNQSDPATINITNSTIQTNNDGTAYYAIITFNPVNMTITNSTLKGWACIYAKDPDGSAGSAGSVFTLENCTLLSTNIYENTSNSFGAIQINDNKVTVNVTNTSITIQNKYDQEQAIAGISSTDKNGNSATYTGNKITLGDGNTVTFNNMEGATGSCEYILNQGSNTFEITGGTYNTDPSAYLSDGYKAVKTSATKWKVLTESDAAAYNVEYTDANGNVFNKKLTGGIFTADGTYKLLSDATCSRIGITKKVNLTLDLNGHTITSTWDKNTFGPLYLSKTATQNPSGSVINIVDNSDGKGGKFVTNGENNAYAIGISKDISNATINIGKGVTIEGNTVLIEGTNNTLNVEGTINGGNDFAIATNGTNTKNANITIKEGAVLTSNVTAMYLPGNEGQVATIEGGTITGGLTGIEIRAGQLIMNSGTVKTTADTYNYTPNGSGTTVKGAAIAVVQHGTLLPMDVQLLNGTLDGLNQIAVVDAQGNNLKDVSVKAKDGFATANTVIPAGFKWVSSEGVSTLTPCDYVAQVGETKYETLADAFAAAADGSTVTLLKNVALTDRLFVNAGAAPAYAGSNNRFATTSENKSITLDLSGNNVTTSSNIALAGGSLNIVNNGTADADHGVISTSDNGLAPIEIRGTGDLASKRTLTVGENVTLKGAEYGLNIFGSNDAQKNDIEVNVNGKVEGTLFVLGNLKNTDNNVVVNVNGSVTEATGAGVSLNGFATVNVAEKAVVEGNKLGIEVRAGNLNVAGGTITAKAEEYTVSSNGSGAAATGAAISVAQHTTGLPINANVSGCTLSGVKTISVADPENKNLEGVTVKVADALANAETVVIPEGYKWVSVDGISTLTKKEYVAQIGEGENIVKYESLAEAVAAATDGATITLLKDVELADRLFVNAGATPVYAGTNNRYATTTENKSITLDLNGNNVTSSSNIALAGGSLNIVNTGTADAEHGVISTTNDGLAPIEIRGTGDLTQKRTMTVGTGVTLSGAVYGLNIFGSNDAQKNIIDVNVNGTVNGTLFVLGNLKNAENEININVAGTVYVPDNGDDEASVGVALNGIATVNVNEGAQVSGETGIEVRAGNLVVNGGNITATASTYSEKKNGSGSCTKGAAVAVAQHTTKLPITATLNGGTLTGTKTLVVTDVEEIGLNDVTVKAADALAKAETVVIPAGYKWVSSEGVSTLTPCDYVAQVGETKYETLADAFAAAADGNTVTLLTNVELTDRLFVNAGAEPTFDKNNRYAITSENKSITLDLSGYNVTTGSNIALAGGSLNIVNSGTADADHGVISTTNDGLAPIEIRGTGDLTQKRTLTVGTGVTLSGAEYGLNVFGSNDEQKNIIDVNVNGTVNGTLFVLGNLKNTENDVVINVNSGASLKGNVGIALNGFATANVADNTTIEGAELGIEVRAGNLNIAGGTITSTATEYTVKSNGDGSAAKGAAISVAQHTTKLPISTNITGCTLNGVKTISVADPENGNLTGVTVKVADALVNAETVVIPEGYKWVSDGTMSTLTPRDPVAKIGEKTYYSLADAIAAVPANGTEATTITLLANVTENVVVKDGKNIVLDLDGKTLTGMIDQYDSQLTVTKGNVAGTVYVNGGPVSAETGYNKFTLAADAAITSDWGFILYQGPNGNDAYGSVIDINGTVNGTAWVMGNIKEGNSVINVNNGAKIEGDVFGLNGLATLNVNEGATIIGAETGIEVRAGNLNVEGGTITSTATEYSVNPNGSGTTTTGAAIAVAQHTTGLPINANIKGGTLSGPKTISVADPQGLNYTDVVVTAKDELTEKENNVIPDGYIWMSNNDGTSTLTKIEDGEYKLIDRVDYPFMNLKSDISVPEVTYQRSFSKTQVDKHQAWYVPMDYTITAEDAKNFTFYKLHMVAGAAEAGEADPNQIYLYVTPMNVGEKLVGNRPYTVKPKAAKENYKFTAENTILYAPNNGSRLNVTTSTHSYDFFGQYENTNYSGNKGDMYYLSQGALHPNNPTTPLLPYRWNIKVSSNSTNDGYAKIGFIIIEDEEATSINTVRDFNADEVEGIYSINGKKLNTPVKGINIIKYKNGKTEKRLIK